MTTATFNAEISRVDLVRNLERSFRTSRKEYGSTIDERKKQVPLVRQNWQNWMWNKMWQALEESEADVAKYQDEVDELQDALCRYAAAYQGNSVADAATKTTRQPELLRNLSSAAMKYLAQLQKVVICLPELSTSPEYLTLFGVKDLEEAGGSLVLPYVGSRRGGNRVTGYMFGAELTIRTEIDMKGMTDSEFWRKMRTAQVEWHRQQYPSETLACVEGVANKIPETVYFEVHYPLPADVKSGSMLDRVAFIRNHLTLVPGADQVTDFIDMAEKYRAKSKSDPSAKQSAAYLEVLCQNLKLWQKIADSALKLVRHKDGSVKDMYPEMYLKEQVSKLREDFRAKFPDLVLKGSLTID